MLLSKSAAPAVRNVYRKLCDNGVVEMEKVFYKYVPAERIDILQNNLIRFTQPFALNDPFEAKPHFHELGSREVFAKTMQRLSEGFPYEFGMTTVKQLETTQTGLH